MIPVVYFVDSAVQTHSGSPPLTDSASLSLRHQLSYHVCDLGLTALSLRVIFILGPIRMTGK